MSSSTAIAFENMVIDMGLAGNRTYARGMLNTIAKNPKANPFDPVKQKLDHDEWEYGQLEVGFMFQALYNRKDYERK